MQNKERIKCIGIGEKQNAMTSTFNDIFASVLRTDSNKQDRSVTYEDLLILMLKLLGKLVQTPLPDQLVRNIQDQFSFIYNKFYILLMIIH